VAFEHDPDFDPFSVYREGDELIGVEVHKKPEVRESELRSVFGDSISLQSAYGRRVSLPTTPRKASAASASSPSGKTSPLYRSPEQPTLTLSPPSSPWSRSDASPRTPTDGIVLTVPELDFSALGALQDLSLEEKLELGRRRHQEYLERTRLEFGDACATGIAV
jgi:hypothetical protein